MDNRFVVILRNMYSPLGPLLEIGKSKNHGHGLFAKTNIPPLTNLGESHFHVPEHGEVIRTPLGGFINHSEESNCFRTTGPVIYYIVTKQLIRENEELTLTYQWYDPS